MRWTCTHSSNEVLQYEAEGIDGNRYAIVSRAIMVGRTARRTWSLIRYEPGEPSRLLGHPPGLTQAKRDAEKLAVERLSTLEGRP
jgi:hypothetical protein